MKVCEGKGIRNIIDSRHETRMWYDTIMELRTFKERYNYAVTHIHREGNAIADAYAKYGSLKHTKEFKKLIKQLIIEDLCLSYGLKKG